MKKIFLLILILSGFFISCDKWIDPSMNKDPNNPTNVAMAQLLAPIEANLAYITGGELVRWDCMWMQQLSGLQSQASEAEIYILGEADVTAAWSYNLYSPGMINTKILMAKAEETNSPHYAGVAKILMAFHLGVTTDHWGDIPYSEALNGSTNQFKPGYDTQEEIYASIMSLLNEAISDLAEPESIYSPGNEDLIYGGDLDKWTQTAYALKARYSIHLAKRNGNAAYTNALTALANSYTSSSNDFSFTFGTAYNNSNPMYQFEQERTAYVGASSTYMSMLSAAGDPRKNIYFNGTVGSVPGVPDANAATIGEKFISSESPVIMVSFVELKFIEAEAAFKTNDKVRSANAYNDGLKASLQREGVYGDGTWYNANKETDISITLEKIMNQKYLSSFLQIEVWNDWRRTGFPVLQRATGAVINEIPRRYPYPDDERLYNGENMPADLTLTSRMWWDVI